MTHNRDALHDPVVSFVVVFADKAVITSVFQKCRYNFTVKNTKKAIRHALFCGFEKQI